MPDTKRKELCLPSSDPRTYKYLEKGAPGDAGNLKDADNFAIVEDGLKSQGMSDAEIHELYQLLAVRPLH